MVRVHVPRRLPLRLAGHSVTMSGPVPLSRIRGSPSVPTDGVCAMTRPTILVTGSRPLERRPGPIALRGGGAAQEIIEHDPGIGGSP